MAEYEIDDELLSIIHKQIATKMKTQTRHKKGKSACFKCKQLEKWKQILLMEILQFMMTEEGKNEFYLKFRKCLKCAWYLVEQEERRKKEIR